MARLNLQHWLHFCHYRQTWKLKSWFRTTFVVFGDVCMSVIVVKFEIAIRDCPLGPPHCLHVRHYRHLWNVESWFGMTFLVLGDTCLSVMAVNFELWNRDSGWPSGSSALSACLSLSSTLKFEIVIRDDRSGLRKRLRVCRYRQLWDLKSRFGIAIWIQRCLHVGHYRQMLNLNSWFGMTFLAFGGVCMSAIIVEFEIWNRDSGWPPGCPTLPARLSSSSTLSLEIANRDELSGLRKCLHVCHYRQIWNLKSWFGIANWIPNAAYMSVIIWNFGNWNRDSAWPSWPSGMPARPSLSSNLKFDIVNVGGPFGSSTLSACLSLSLTSKYEIVIRDDLSGLRRCQHVCHDRQIWYLKPWFGMTTSIPNNAYMFVIIVNCWIWNHDPGWHWCSSGGFCMRVITIKFEIWNRDSGWPPLSSDMFPCMPLLSNLIFLIWNRDSGCPIGSPSLFGCLAWPSNLKFEIVNGDDLPGLRRCLHVCHYRQIEKFKAWFGMAIWIPNIVCMLVFIVNFKCSNRDSGWPSGSSTLCACVSLWYNLKPCSSEMCACLALSSNCSFEIVNRDGLLDPQRCLYVCRSRQIWDLTPWILDGHLDPQRCLHVCLHHQISNWKSWFGMTFLLFGSVCMYVVIFKLNVWNRGGGLPFESQKLSACHAITVNSEIWNRDSNWPSWPSEMPACRHYRHIWFVKPWFGMTTSIPSNVCMSVIIVKLQISHRASGWQPGSPTLFAFRSPSSILTFEIASRERCLHVCN